ncbi:MAG: toxin TcdB middle/N-terminal domain-containing protein, partial [Myxococcota bacterium]
VLAADMNGNGSVDITWVGANGSVRYLDLFPLRSHLLTRIENGLGRVTEIEYQSSVEQRAASEERGDAWAYPLPHAMIVVSRTDEYDLLTNVHDVVEFRYRDGFYDGIERQFRGYAQVEQIIPGDASLEDGRTLSLYNVGDTQPHLNGQLVFERRESGGRVIDEVANTYGEATECSLAEVPDNSTLQALGRRTIGFPCLVASEKVVQEGLASSAHVTIGETMEYGDGYGNVTRSSQMGFTSIGGGGCEACARSEGAFGSPCGNQCLGDESFVERTFVSSAGTSGRWILGAVARERRFGVADGSGVFAESRYFYDGDAFVGLPLGELTQGKLTRREDRVDGSKTIQSVRNRFDVHGNVVESLDPLGAAQASSHRRTWNYDSDGLRVTRTELFNQPDAGTPYRLRRAYQYDLLFDRVTLSSNWIRVEDDIELTPADPVAYTYDSFGRLASALLPGGDSGASPTFVYSYDLGNPTTRLITRRRSELGGDLDLESIACVDGRGRVFQRRQRLESGRYLVSGLTLYNLRSQPLEVFQPYESSSAQCDERAPDGVLSMRYRYDAVRRTVEVVHPDSLAAGGASFERFSYEPLETHSFDAEDTDLSSPHHSTPTIRQVDGLGRLVQIERNLADAAAVTKLEYDALGYNTSYVDAAGRRKIQTFDA